LSAGVIDAGSRHRSLPPLAYPEDAETEAISFLTVDLNPRPSVAGGPVEAWWADWSAAPQNHQTGLKAGLSV
jgi:hypothetical protein